MQEIIFMEPGKHEPHVRKLFWAYLSWANGRPNEEYGDSVRFMKEAQALYTASLSSPTPRAKSRRPSTRTGSSWSLT